MNKKQCIYKNAIDDINNTLLRFFGISLKKINGKYVVVKYYQDYSFLYHYPDEEKECVNDTNNRIIRDNKYTICEYEMYGGNYQVRVIEDITNSGNGSIRLLIEDGERVWDLCTTTNSKKGVPHSTLSLKRLAALREDNYLYMNAPETCVKPAPDGVLDGIKRDDITGGFYLLGELVLITTFDKIFIKKKHADGKYYFSQCEEELSRDNLIELLEDYISANTDFCFDLMERVSKETLFKYTYEEFILLKNFLSSRVDELISDMKINRKQILDRYNNLSADDDIIPPVVTGKVRHYRRKDIDI